MSPFSKNVYYRLPVIAFCIVIFWQSSLPGLFPNPIFSYQDKLLHCAGYAILAYLATRWLTIEKWPDRKTTIRITAFLLTALYGLSDEIHQAFVPSRFASPTDFAADALGAAIGSMAYPILQKQPPPIPSKK